LRSLRLPFPDAGFDLFDGPLRVLWRHLGGLVPTLGAHLGVAQIGVCRFREPAMPE